MQFNSLDTSFDEKFEGYDSISVMHALFDGFLQPELGSNALNSMEFFEKLLNFPEFKKTAACSIVNNSLKKIENKFRESNIKRIEFPMKGNVAIPLSTAEHIANRVKFYVEDNNVEDDNYVEEDNYAKDDDYGEDDYYDIDYDDYVDDTYDIYKRLKDGLSMMNIRDNLDFDLLGEYNLPDDSLEAKTLAKLRNLFHPIFTVFLERNPSLICDSGWEGHLVGFYYEKEDNDLYTYGFFNSGGGIQYHEQNGTKTSVYKLFKGTKENLVNMLAYIYIFCDVLALKRGNTASSLSDYFYRYMPSPKDQVDYDPPHTKSMKWIYPQLSGTCTYFGFYYSIKYIFYSRYEDKKFSSFDTHIKNECYGALISYMEKNKILSPKHKLFLDLISDRKKDLDSKLTSRIDKLYIRYTVSVRLYSFFEPQHTDGSSRVNNKVLQFSLPNTDRSIYEFLPTSDLVDIPMNLADLQHIFELFNQEGNHLIFTEFGNYLYISYIIRFLVGIVNYPDEVYEKFDETYLNDLPQMLRELNTHCQLMIGENNVLSRLIQFMFRIVFLRINESNDYYYFPKSSVDYDATTVRNYYDSLSNVEDEINYYHSGVLPIKKHFKLIVDYYDIVLSTKYIGRSPQNNTTFNLQDYCKLFTENVVPSSFHTGKFEVVANILLLPEKMFSNIFELMGPLEFDDIGKGKRRIPTNIFQLSSLTGLIETTSTIETHNPDSSIASLTDNDILNISKHFIDNTVSQLNSIYKNTSALMMSNRFVFHQRHFVDIQFNIETNNTTTDALDSAVVNDQSSEWYTDYEDRYNKNRELLKIVTKKESLETMFSVLDEMPIMVILNFLLYYNGNQLPPESTQIILEYCKKKIEKPTEANFVPSIYQTVCLILSKDVDIMYELGVVKQIHTVLMSLDSLRETVKSFTNKNFSQDIFDKNTSQLLMELYSIYLIHLSPQGLTNHCIRVQSFMLSGSPSTVVDKYAEILSRDSNRRTIVDFSSDSYFIRVKTTDKDGNITRETLVNGNFSSTDHSVSSNPFLNQFSLLRNQYNSIGVAINKNIGYIRFVQHNPNTPYVLHRLFDIEVDGQKTTLEFVAIEGPKTKDGNFSIPFFPKPGSISSNRMYNNNIMFYKKRGNDTGDIYIEFDNFWSQEYKLPLFLRLDVLGKVYFIDEKLVEYEILTEAGPFVVNQWIYGLPYAFIFADGLGYKMIYVDIPLLSNDISLEKIGMSKWWIDSKKSESYVKKYLLDNFRYSHNVSYRIAKIDYHGLGCTFESIEDMRSYLLSCIMFGKSDCFNVLLPKYLSWLNLIHKDSPEKIETDEIVDHIVNGYLNSPYSHCFQNMLYQHLKVNDSKYFYFREEYLERVRQEIYGDKYNNSLSHQSQTFTLESPELSLDKLFTMKPLSQTYATKVNEYVKLLTSFKTDVSSKKEIKSLQNIADSIVLFNSEYQTCDIDKKHIDLQKLLKKVVRRYHKRLHRLDNIPNFHKQSALTSIDKFVVENAGLFYELLNLKTLHNVIADLIKLGKTDNCLEIKTIYDKINREIFYKGERDKTIIVFEIFSGFYIRDEQYNIYKEITDDIDRPMNEKTSYRIHQLLMGKGKTSVIMPLIMFHYLYSDQTDIYNIFSILPQHLTKVAYYSLYDSFYPILSKIIVVSLTMGRIDASKHQLFNSYYEDLFGDSDQKKIIIASDTSYKTIRLNEVIYLQNRRAKNFYIQRNSVTIFDEFDNQYDPTTSDLNFPNDVISLEENPVIDVVIQNLFVDFIIDNIDELTDKSVESLSVTQLFERFYKNTQAGLDPNFISEAIVGKSLQSDSSDQYRLRCVLYNVYKQFLDCEKMVYLKDYGFPTSKSHSPNTMYLAVPYSAVNSPINGSEFSDIDIVMILTIFTHTRHELRVTDVEKVVRSLQSELTNIGKYIDEDTLNKIFREKKDILGIDSVLDILNIYPDRLTGYAEKIAQNILLRGTEKQFKKYFLKTEVLKRIHFASTNYNCSFIDVVSQTMCYRKAAFSGTVYLDLPKYDNPDRVFVGVKTNLIDDGSTYAALLGVYQKEQKILSVDKPDTVTMLDYLIDILKTNQHNVLIDSGAFLRTESLNSVVKALQTKLNKKYVVYVDEKDTTYISVKDVGLINYYGQTNRFDSNELFIYYDNRHILGTDIKQPYTLSGLVTVSPWNNIVDISQATFRMRNLNYGHRVDFITNQIPDVNDTVSLVYSLHRSVWKKLNGSAKIKKNEQELKSKYRERYLGFHKENFFNKYFEMTLFDLKKTPVPNITNMSYMRYISETWENPSELIGYSREVSYDGTKYIFKIEKLLEGKLPIVLNTNKEIDREVDTNKNIATVTKIPKMRFSITASYLGNVPFSFYLYPADRIDDILMNRARVTETFGIYWTPPFVENRYDFFDPYVRFQKSADSPKREENPEYPEYYHQLLQATNNYYIKYLHDNKYETYTLISYRECSILLGFIKKHPNFEIRNVWLKDKQGNILLGTEDSRVSAKELFVRFLLGKSLNIEESLIMIALFRENNDTLELAERFSAFYGFYIFDKSLYSKHISCELPKYSSMIAEAIKGDIHSINFLFEGFIPLEHHSHPKVMRYISSLLEKLQTLYRADNDVSFISSDIGIFTKPPKMINIWGTELKGGYQISQAWLKLLNRKKDKYKKRYLDLKYRSKIPH